VRPVTALLALAALLIVPTSCAPALEVDGARAQSRVRHQVEAGPRIPGSPGHAAVRAWLESELGRLGARVERRDFTDSTLGRPLALSNLVARYGPPGAPLVFCAHWDSRPFADQDPDTARRGDPVPGANDGASGVAVLLELAELMSRRPPGVPVQLVFLDGEDQGEARDAAGFCLGARRFAGETASGPERPRAVFLFDMVGDRDLQIHPEGESARRAANLVSLVLEGAKKTGARHFHREPRYSLTDDHIPFLDNGIPAVDIIDFDYPAWHTTQDLPSQTSAESLAEVARVGEWILYSSPLARPVPR